MSIAPSQAADHAITTRLIIAGCSRRKRPAAAPLPALELYQGGCLPQLRARLGRHRQCRDRIRILSAEHGLLTADTPVLPYDRRLDTRRAAQLRPAVRAALDAEAAAHGTPSTVLIIAEPLYLRLLDGLVRAREPRPHLIWIPDPRGWPAAAAVLDDWGWP